MGEEHDPCSMQNVATSWMLPFLLAAVKTAYAGQLGYCSQAQTAHFSAARESAAEELRAVNANNKGENAAAAPADWTMPS